MKKIYILIFNIGKIKHYGLKFLNTKNVFDFLFLRFKNLYLSRDVVGILVGTIFANKQRFNFFLVVCNAS